MISMSQILEQGPINNGGLCIDGLPTQILIEKRQNVSPPEEFTQIIASNSAGYEDLMEPPVIHSTKQKAVREVIKRALSDDHEVTSQIGRNTSGDFRYESVDGRFKLVGPFVVGIAEAKKQKQGIVDTYSSTHHKYSIGRLGLKGVLGMKSTPIWKRARNQFQS